MIGGPKMGDMVKMLDSSFYEKWGLGMVTDVYPLELFSEGEVAVDVEVWWPSQTGHARVGIEVIEVVASAGDKQ